MAASHLYLSTETKKSTGSKLRTKLYIYTRVERALRTRIGPWALVCPPFEPAPPYRRARVLYIYWAYPSLQMCTS